MQCLDNYSRLYFHEMLLFVKCVKMSSLEKRLIQYSLYEMHPGEGKICNGDFINSEVTVESTKFLSLKYYCIYGNSLYQGLPYKDIVVCIVFLYNGELWGDAQLNALLT